MFRQPLWILLAACCLAATGCGDRSGSGSGHRLQVVATTTQIGDWVRRVGGTRVALHQILQPNTDPHEYEPRPRDVESTASARIVFENGDGLDGWMSRVVDESGSQPTIVDLGAAAPVRLRGESSGPEASRFDPHWWHDPRNAGAAVAAIRSALVRADPAGASAYRANARAYLAQLRTLDSGIRGCFAGVPAADRKLVTDHDAFGYFAHRYGIAVVGAVIPAQTTQAQPSAGELADLIELIRREHVTAVFPETSLNPRLVHTIAQATGATSSRTLYGDTLGPAGSSGADYLSMERANADAMVSAFTAGERGCALDLAETR